MASSSRPVNPHLTDANLRPFSLPGFSPTDYLNSTLPSFKSTKQQQPAPSLSAIAAQAQSQVSSLNAQTSRLSTTLTNLTDDILRTSSRLAYEVELLRGEALALADSLSSRGDFSQFISRFVSGGLKLPNEPTESPNSPSKERQESEGFGSLSTSTAEPEALPRLRTLLHVRAQLQIVIQRFNQALSFSFPPSLLATATSSLISLNPPNQDPDLESKGQAGLSRLKQEISSLAADADGLGGGFERARELIAELRDLCTIWKGTGEEAARLKWVDSLDQMIDDEVRKTEESRKKGAVGRSKTQRDASAVRSGGELSGTGPGFLRRLREEIYMD